VPEKIKKLGVVLVLSSFFTLLNPSGAAGALLPLHIFDSYGYRLVENQTVWFIEKLISYPPIRYFKIAFITLILSWLYATYRSVKKKQQLSVANLIFTIFFSILGWTAIRNFTIFGYFALPIAAINFRSIKKAKAKTTDDYFLLTILSFVLIIFIVVINQPFWSTRKINGFGLREGVQSSAQFFKKNKIKGPIFNNYDLGGYLIYNLYPKERIFVDNRPETYPVSFFEKIYIPM
jgi:hypothetical protein